MCQAHSAGNSAVENVCTIIIFRPERSPDRVPVREDGEKVIPCRRAEDRKGEKPTVESLGQIT